MKRKQDEEATDVENLERWTPAPVLVPGVPR